MKARWVLSSAIVLGLGMGFTQAQATPGDLGDRTRLGLLLTSSAPVFTK